MAKTSSGVRTYKQGTSTYNKRQAEVVAMRESGKYSSVEIGKGGGYVAIEKSPARHKPEELEAARILADKGYKVVLKDESGMDQNMMAICLIFHMSKEHLQEIRKPIFVQPSIMEEIRVRIFKLFI